MSAARFHRPSPVVAAIDSEHRRFSSAVEEWEAQVLRDEWARLAADGGQLRLVTRTLRGSTDRSALTAHAARLHEFSQRLQAFRDALEEFHDTYERGAGLPLPAGN